MSQTEVYLNVKEITEVRTKKVQLKDVADLWCEDSHLANRLNALTIKTIREDKDWSENLWLPGGGRRQRKSLLSQRPRI